MEQINTLLFEHIKEPYNDEIMFSLGTEYFNIHQYASAFTYFQRCADYSHNNKLITECLLTCSRILTIQGDRDQKEYDMILHALSIEENCPEVYYIKSCYHSWRNQWTECYTTCCLALKYLNNFDPIFRNNKYFKYNNKNNILFQKALSAKQKGKVSEARNLFIQLNNISELEKLPSPFEIPHTNETNYSQSFQDLFVLKMCNYKKQG
jgi:hypothetical protein